MKPRPPNEDLLSEVVAERSERNPDFELLVDAALTRRRLLRELARKREELGLTQTTVAAKMATSQSFVARLEAGDVDTKLSTVERFASALGLRIEWQLVGLIEPPASD